MLGRKIQDIKEKKEGFTLSPELRNIFSKIQFKKYYLDLKGSSALKVQKYFSDYDLFTQITKKYTTEEAYNEFEKIINKISRCDNAYIIEFKVQKSDGVKHKWKVGENFDLKTFKKFYKDIDFCKLDFVIFTDNKFIEASIIYKFGEETFTDDFLNNLITDAKEYEQEGSYFKSLKRRFSIYILTKNIKYLIPLIRILNNNMGALYAKIANLKTIKTIIENYDDELINRRVSINLKDIGENPNMDLKELDEKINVYDKIINNYAKKIIKRFPI